MEQDFYADRLRSHGLEVEIPPAEDRAVVHRVIYDELCRGVVSDDSRDAYLEIIARLVARGCEGVILGCTEIELLLPMDEAYGVPLFPTTRLHVTAAVDAAL
jgi:aspartate racemase